MKYRKLRIAWSVAWGVVAVLLCVLWVSSYWLMHQAQFKLPNANALIIVLAGGTTRAAIVEVRYPMSYGVFTSVTSSDQADEYQRKGWESTWSRSQMNTRVPAWFPAIVCCIIAPLSWLTFRRFSLRALLILMTLIAVGLGAIIWATGDGRHVSLERRVGLWCKLPNWDRTKLFERKG